MESRVRAGAELVKNGANRELAIAVCWILVYTPHLTLISGSAPSVVSPIHAFASAMIFIV